MSYRNLIDLDDVTNGVGGIKITGESAGDIAGTAIDGRFDVNGDGRLDLIIGAAFDDTGGNLAGAAYVVFGQAGGFDSDIDLGTIAAGTGGFKIIGQAASDFAGTSVASAGDVNSDGIDDLIIGASGNNSRGESGAAYVVYGRNGGFPAQVNLDDVEAGGGGFKIRGEQDGDSAGTQVASAGDINGDGIDDLVVTAPFATGLANDKGATYVVFGKEGGFSGVDLLDVAAGTGGFRLLGEGNYDRTGYSTASAGDVNGDGFDDLIIGSTRFRDAGNNVVGSAYVVFGSDDPFAASIDLADIARGAGGFRLVGERQFGDTGESVAGAGDVNGDGIDDVIIGARSETVGGAAYVVFGKTGGFAGSIDLATIAAGNGGFKIVGEPTSRVAGWSVDTAGDVNGDGIDDMLVGATGKRDADDPGAAYVVFGQRGGFDTPVQLSDIAIGDGGFKIQGQNDDDYAGFSVSAAGDVNGDGFDDVLVGARLNDGGGSQSGAAYVVYGQAENKAPVAVDDLYTLDEDSLGFTGESVLVRGIDSDADGDALTVVAVGGAAGNVGVATAGSNGGSFTIAADGSLAFAPGADFAGLGQGVTRTTAVSYTIGDGHGSFDTAEVKVTVEGLNDAPTVAQRLPGQTIIGGPPVSIALLAPNVAFADADVGDVLTVQSVQGLPTGLRYDAASNSIVGSAGQLGRFTITETVGDGHGATASQSFVLDVRAATVLFTTGDDTRDLNTINVDAFGNSATRALAGNDTVTLSDTGQKGIMFHGDAGNDRILGSVNNDRIHGDDGVDTLSGRTGRDKLWGDAGKDSLAGGTGADHFLFGKAGDSGASAAARDVIADFRHADGDRINLSALDANPTLAGNQKFVFVGQSAFTGVGQVHFTHPDAYSTIVEVNLGGDLKPDMQIELAGKIALVGGDFVL